MGVLFMKDIKQDKVIYYEGLDLDERRIYTLLNQFDGTLAQKYLLSTGKASYEKPDHKKFHDWKTINGKFRSGDVNAVAFLINKYPENSTIVEMGVWKGWSTSLIIPALKKDYKYYCVDWFKGSPTESCEGADPLEVKEEFWKRIKEEDIFHKIKLIHGESTYVAKEYFKDNSVDVIFLDGAHTEPYFSNDVEAWNKKIKVGGIFAGHDWSTVGNVARGLFTEKNGYKHINLKDKSFGEHDCWAYKKISKGVKK